MTKLGTISFSSNYLLYMSTVFSWVFSSNKAANNAVFIKYDGKTMATLTPNHYKLSLLYLAKADISSAAKIAPKVYLSSTLGHRLSLLRSSLPILVKLDDHPVILFANITLLQLSLTLVKFFFSLSLY